MTYWYASFACKWKFTSTFSRLLMVLDFGNLNTYILIDGFETWSTILFMAVQPAINFTRSGEESNARE